MTGARVIIAMMRRLAQSQLYLKLLGLLPSWHTWSIRRFFERFYISRNIRVNASDVYRLIKLNPLRKHSRWKDEIELICDNGLPIETLALAEISEDLFYSGMHRQCMDCFQMTWLL